MCRWRTQAHPEALVQRVLENVRVGVPVGDKAVRQRRDHVHAVSAEVQVIDEELPPGSSLPALRNPDGRGEHHLWRVLTRIARLGRVGANINDDGRHLQHSEIAVRNAADAKTRVGAQGQC